MSRNLTSTLQFAKVISHYSCIILCRVIGLRAFRRFEPCAVKIARTFLRRGKVRNTVLLSDLPTWYIDRLKFSQSFGVLHRSVNVVKIAGQEFQFQSTKSNFIWKFEIWLSQLYQFSLNLSNIS